jgi:acyl-CoA thioesterase FadM
MSVTFTQGELVINDVSLLKKNKNHSRNAHFNPYSALCDGVSRKARVFERLCDVRFTDLDPLGIVRPSFYLDAVVSSRWTYLEKDLGVSVLELAERGFGVYLVSSNVECFSPIARTLPIRVRSYVAVTEKKLMKVRFEIRSDDLSVIFANGEFDSLMIDLKTRKTQILPSWVEPYIYERGDFSN